MIASDAGTASVAEDRAIEREETQTTSDRDDSEPQTDGDRPLDVIFGILKNRRRRLVLQYLVEISETTTLSDLAEHIAAVENDKSEQALTSSERKRVYVCLYQCHLPKMDDAGVIHFETDRGTVELADDTEVFFRYLDTDDDEPERVWSRYYVALAAAGGLAFVAQQLLFPSALLSGVVVGAMLGLYVNLALEHAYNRGLLTPGVGTDGDGAAA